MSSFVEKVGVLVVSYGARAVAMVDALTHSINYDVEIYVVDKQKNPFNVKNSVEHIVIPDLDINEICKFAEANKGKIDFTVVGPEKPIINGVRDLIEERTSIPVICPTKEYAIEASKVAQRLLFEDIVPEVNPRFRIFAPQDYTNQGELRKAVYEWLDQLGNNVVVKPDRPAAGKGVGVWGDHFTTRQQLFEHFLANFQYGRVIIEERIEGEESSFQAFCDGKHLVPLPETRDYKRAFDGDKGPNTGGMGSYKDVDSTLPFMTEADRAKEVEIVTRIFQRWKLADNKALRGMPFYVAFMHTGSGPKILENNSRPGDPEIINILPALKVDFVEVCLKILEGNLTHIELNSKATVVTYKVPPTYGGYASNFPAFVKKEEIDKPVSLASAHELAKRYRERLHVYPAAMELRDSETYALRSRALCAVGVGESIEEARQISIEGLRAVRGGALWFRKDIGSRQHVDASITHMEELRRRK